MAKAKVLTKEEEAELTEWLRKAVPHVKAMKSSIRMLLHRGCKKSAIEHHLRYALNGRDLPEELSAYLDGTTPPLK
jgi:hypothetical protein